MIGRLSFMAACFCAAGSLWAQQGPDSPAFWLSRAHAEASGLSDAGERAGVLTSLAFDFASEGDGASANNAADEAADAASRISDPQGRFSAYLGLAGFNDQMGRPEQSNSALSAADAALGAISAGEQKQAAISQLRQIRDVISGWPAPRQAIEAISDPAQRVVALTTLADGYAQEQPRHRADFAAALSQADADAGQVTDISQKGMLQALIVQTRARDGDLSGAAEAADKIVDPSAQGTAYAALADAYGRSGQKSKAQASIAAMAASADASPEDHRAAIWLNIARARQSLGDVSAAREAVDSAVHAADHLESADQADALAAAARLRADLGDTAGASVLAGDAASAARGVTDPQDAAEVNMTVAAAEARCGLMDPCRQSISAAQQAAASLPPQKRRPGGDPPAAAYMDVIQAAASAGAFSAALDIAASVNDPRIMHDAALAVAGAEINLSQYQAAEDTAAKEGSLDAEAAVCGMISASLARNRTPAETLRWIQRLSNPSDKVAACLAVAEVEMAKAAAPATRP